MNKASNVISRQRIFFYVLTLAAFILIYIKLSELLKLRDVFIQANWNWLLGMLFFSILNYVFTTRNYQEILMIKKLEIPFKELFPVAYIITFITSIIPSGGLSGQVFFVQYLKKYGLSISEGIGRAILEVLTLYIAFLIFFIISFGMLFHQNIIQEHPSIFIFIYGFLLLFGIVIGIILTVQKKRRIQLIRNLTDRLQDRFANTRFERISSHAAKVPDFFEEISSTLHFKNLYRHREHFWDAVLWQMLLLLSNVMILWCTGRALGWAMPFSVAFITFTLIKLVTITSIIPGALGLFEGIMTVLLLSFGAQPGLAITVMLLFRLFTFWLPLPIGWLLYGRYSRQLAET